MSWKIELKEHIGDKPEYPMKPIMKELLGAHAATNSCIVSIIGA